MIVRSCAAPKCPDLHAPRFDQAAGRGGVEITPPASPAAVWIMDSLSIVAVEAAVHPNFPPADSVLIVELDGPAAEVREQFTDVEAICRRAGATTVEVAQDEAHRARIWKGRKGAFASMGRVTPNYYVQDGVVPRTKLPEVLERIRQLETRCGLRIGNVFHAGTATFTADLLRREDPGRRAGREVAAKSSVCARRRFDHRRTRCARQAEVMPLSSRRTISTSCSSCAARFSKVICTPGKVFPAPRLCAKCPVLTAHIR